MILNVRGFPDELNQALKVEAAKRGMSLRELVIEKCSANLIATSQPQQDGKLKRPKAVRERPVAKVDAVHEETAVATPDTRKRDHCPTDRTELVAMGSRAVCPQCGANYPILAQYYYPGT